MNNERKLKQILKKIKSNKVSDKDKMELYKWIENIVTKIPMGKIDSFFVKDLILESYIQVFESVKTFNFKRKAIPWLISLIRNTAMRLKKIFQKDVELDEGILLERFNSEEVKLLRDRFFDGLEKVIEICLLPEKREVIWGKLLNGVEDSFLTFRAFVSKLVSILEEEFPGQILIKKDKIVAYLKSLKRNEDYFD